MTREVLPPSALRRLAQAAASGVWGSELSPAEFAALRAVEFQPTGQVLGTAVYATSLVPARVGLFQCMGADRMVAWDGYDWSHMVSRLEQAHGTAIERMAAECRALGGDGVVGVRHTVTPFADTDCLEYRVSGTAVRAAGGVHPAAPFTSDLSAQDFAKLIAAGWVPVCLVYGIGVRTRHDGLVTASQLAAYRNVEVTGHTRHVGATRGDARERLAHMAAQAGADGLVCSGIELRTSPQPCRTRQGARDHVVRVTATGTAIARFDTRAGRSAGTLGVLRLDR